MKGASGLGKSTMMNTLFKSKVNRWVSSDTSEDKLIPATVEIKTVSHGIFHKPSSLLIT